LTFAANLLIKLYHSAPVQAMTLSKPPKVIQQKRQKEKSPQKPWPLAKVSAIC